MSDALPLPPRPNLEQYKKLAKDFQDACTSGDPAQSAIGPYAGWKHLPACTGTRSRLTFDKRSTGSTERVERQWHKIRKSKERLARCTLADAQFFVARCHGFASWPKFARHVETLARANSPVSNFEAAVDAIVSGNISTLARAAARSSRARAGTFDAGTSFDAASLRVGERRRRLPSEDPEEHRRYHEAAVERRCRCQRGVGRIWRTIDNARIDRHELASRTCRCSAAADGTADQSWRRYRRSGWRQRRQWLSP